MKQLPKCWNDVTVDEYISMKCIRTENITLLDRYIEILSIFTNVPIEAPYWSKIGIIEISEMIEYLKWMKTQPEEIFQKNINDLRCIDINKLSLGEFIELDHFLTEDLYGNFTKICAILYRKYESDKWGNIIYEPREYDLEERSLLFNEYSINKVYGMFKYFLDFKNLIVSSYDLFESPVIFEDFDDDNIGYDELEQEEIRREELNKKWAWEGILYKLSKGDITKYDEILNLPIIFVLNQLSFIKEMKNFI